MSIAAEKKKVCRFMIQNQGNEHQTFEMRSNFVKSHLIYACFPTRDFRFIGTCERLLPFEGAYTFPHQIDPGNGESSLSGCVQYILKISSSNYKQTYDRELASTRKCHEPPRAATRPHELPRTPKICQRKSTSKKYETIFY